MTLLREEVAWIATAIGALIAVCTICFTVFQYYKNTKINRARFWLDLRTMFASHDKVHVDLKPGSKWGAIRTVLEKHDAYEKYRLAPTKEGPSTPQEWAPVEAYMGLFELCEMMLKQNLIDEYTFESLYKYRLTNMMWNKVIVNQKIIGRASGWRRFNDLLDRFAIVKQVREPQEETIGSMEVAMSQQVNEQNDNNHLDYEQTLATYRMLADIRFKLLAFIPVVSGIAIVLLTRDLKTVQESPHVALVLGLLGFFVTLGIALYDQRNSRLHDATVGYARDLEHGKGHINRMRHTPKLKLFGIVKIWHDRALALIYGSVLGAWLFPVAYATFIMVSNPSGDSSKMADLRWLAGWIAGSVAILAAIIFIAEFHRLEKAKGGGE